MLANVLNNPKAIQVSIQIIRTFISLRKLVGANKDLTNKLWKIGEKHDQRVKIVLKTIQQLQESSSGSSRRMELKIEEPKAIYLKSRKT